MSQRPQFASDSIQPGALPTLSNTPHTSSQDPPSLNHGSQQPNIQEPPPTSKGRRVSIQEPPPVSHGRRVSIQEPLPTSQSRRVSIQEPPPVSHGRRVSIQEPLPTSHGRRVSIQEPPPVSHGRRVSIQEPLPISHGRRVSVQEPPPTSHSRRVSIQDPTSQSRLFSIQEPPPTSQSRRVSIQEPPPVSHGRRVSIQEPPLTGHTSQLSVQDPTSQSRLFSTQEPPPTSQSRRVSIQDAPLAIYGRRFSNRDPLSIFQTRYFRGQSVPTGSPTPNLESLTQDSLMEMQAPASAIQSLQLSTHGLLSAQPSSGVFSILSSPTFSTKSRDSIMWSSQETSKELFSSSQSLHIPPEGNVHTFRSLSFVVARTNRSPHWRRHSSLLPIGWWLLHEARKISRVASLVLSLAGMVIIGLISLGEPWMHFQVPLKPPGDPAGSRTFPITTIFFVRCKDISCLREYDQNAYLLDSAWLFITIASFIGFCICVTLLNIIFFRSSNWPVLDFSLFITSTLTAIDHNFHYIIIFPESDGTSMILGVLFYLLQAQEYLQEGMTYSLGRSFYLAWTGIFFFLMTGFLSYMNYINFWSILALQAIWT